MKISVCPKCYKAGKVIEGKLVSKEYELWLKYFCENCKDTYKE